MYPAVSECVGLGHPVVALPGGERFADYGYCICHAFYTDLRGVKRRNPEPADSL